MSDSQPLWPPDEDRDHAGPGVRLQCLRSGDGRQLAAARSPQPAVLVADKSYDPVRIREDIKSRNAVPMIPIRKNARTARDVGLWT